MGSGFWLKGCPRCGGDMYEDVDMYGAYLACLQCGHNVNDGLLPGETNAGYAYSMLNMEKRHRPRLKYSR